MKINLVLNSPLPILTGEHKQQPDTETTCTTTQKHITLKN